MDIMTELKTRKASLAKAHKIATANRDALTLKIEELAGGYAELTRLESLLAQSAVQGALRAVPRDPPEAPEAAKPSDSSDKSDASDPSDS